MISEDIIMVVCADLANQVRGKGFPASERETRIRRGVGWVPTNSLITCFNTIADSPFGSLGDLLLVPDERAEVRVAFDDGSAPEHFMLGDIRTLDGAAWNFCPRSILQTVLTDLLSEAGVQLKVAFEHEFWSVADEAGTVVELQFRQLQTLRGVRTDAARRLAVSRPHTRYLLTGIRAGSI